MKKVIFILCLLLCLSSKVYANLTADEIRELNAATPGTFKVQLGTILSTEQDNIDTNTTTGATNATDIAALEAFTSDINDVAFLTTGDTSLTLTNVAYVRKWMGSNNEGINLGVGSVNGQVVTFALAKATTKSTLFITPDTASGFARVSLDHTGDTATLKYINSTIGWLLQGLVTSDTGGVLGPASPWN